MVTDSQGRCGGPYHITTKFCYFICWDSTDRDGVQEYPSMIKDGINFDTKKMLSLFEFELGLILKVNIFAIKYFVFLLNQDLL